MLGGGNEVTRRRAQIAALSLALVGAVLIWKSIDWGLSAGTTTYRDPQTGYFTSTGSPEKQQGYTANLRLMGALLLGVGLYRGLQSDEP